MIEDIVIAFSAFTAIAATFFVAVAVLWLKKLKDTVANAVGETAAHQIKTAQRLNEAISQTQKQQQVQEQKLQALLQANIRLRQDMSAIISHLENAEQEDRRQNHGFRTLH